MKVLLKRFRVKDNNGKAVKYPIVDVFEAGTTIPVVTEFGNKSGYVQPIYVENGSYRINISDSRSTTLVTYNDIIINS